MGKVLRVTLFDKRAGVSTGLLNYIGPFRVDTRSVSAVYTIPPLGSVFAR